MSLKEFEAAPASVQTAFWAEVRAEVESKRELDEWVRSEIGDDPLAQVDSPPHRLETHWDDRWRRRVRAANQAETNPSGEWTADRESDPLMQIPTRVYVEELTGVEVPHSGRICCPFPDHDDPSPSFLVYESGWNCFGCNRGGTIYDLAAVLWDVHPRGEGFVELHKRLRGRFVQ